MTSSKCGMREARHGAAGLSAHGRSRARATARTSALVSPASANGRSTRWLVAAWEPGLSGLTDVVGVLAVGDRGQPVPGDDLVGDAGEQLVLAVETAVRAVGTVGGVLALVRDHLDQGNPNHRGDGAGGPVLVAGQACRRRPGSPTCGPAPGRGRPAPAGRRSRRHRRRRRPAGSAVRWRQPPAGRRGRWRRPVGGPTPVGRGSRRGERLAPPGCPGNCSSRRCLLGWLHRLGLLPHRSGPHPAPAPSPAPTGCPAIVGLSVEQAISHRS